MTQEEAQPSTDKTKVAFGSNAIRLSCGQWIAVGVIVAALFCLTPSHWERMERFDPGPDYRIPYELSNDYWLFSRWCRSACSRPSTLIIGDSVVWGQYVAEDQTLSHYLSELAGGDPFAFVASTAWNRLRRAICVRKVCLGQQFANRVMRVGVNHSFTAHQQRPRTWCPAVVLPLQ